VSGARLVVPLHPDTRTSRKVWLKLDHLDLRRSATGAGGRWFSKGGYAIRRWEQAQPGENRGTHVTAIRSWTWRALPEGAFSRTRVDRREGVLSAPGQRTLLGACRSRIPDVGAECGFAERGPSRFCFRHGAKVPPV